MARTRRPTMADVAARAGVSLSTVSLTYSGAGPLTAETRAKVERAAAELDYAGPSPHARALRSGRTGVVGVVIHERLQLSFRDPLMLRIMDGLVGDLGQMGLGVLLIPTPTGEPGERSLLDTAAMDAVVLLRVRDHDDEPALDILRRRGLPTAVVEGEPPAGAGVVLIDDRTATAELIRHLRDLGHERIGTITLPAGVDGTTRELTLDEAFAQTAWTPVHHRLRAFEDAGVAPCVVVEARASTVGEGLAAAQIALGHEARPTALVCQSDLLAGGAVLAARERGLEVPADLSVTGFDGLDLPWIAPLEITTQLQDGEAKGHALAALVKALLAGETPEPVTLPLTFRPGTSTAPPRG
ncbi:LacI family DNA-binding transcriptional regulator [Demequina sp. SYSU T00039]|uniref:LacI family DNA-binding transcriptional regulator n=1 Tax=Demequina lignilytica TaxID=3051663 RepID=A0AAW7M5W2_9MICO|nr:MULTISPECIES: LacI family DNA-binding transcriptional regulator [unclassified Demequina]MDN4478073.1 LacI family DNA-binding transcriptional regulator [Demequina sp. SYSU T00039-1]MDN4488477.1 LacI family DNA-binding transcriptional regulator [Demequina sp. SYSU T00039]